MQSATVELAERFEMDQPAETVWTVLSDPRHVVSCVPGAALAQELADGAFEGSLTAALGPTVARFRGTVTPTFDSSELRGSLVVSGMDERGRSRAQMQTTFTVESPNDDRTSVLKIEARVAVTGGLAPFVGTGGVHLARRMLAEFAENLRQSCARSGSGRTESDPVARARIVPMLGRALRDLLSERIAHMWRSVRPARRA